MSMKPLPRPGARRGIYMDEETWQMVRDAAAARALTASAYVRLLIREEAARSKRKGL